MIMSSAELYINLANICSNWNALNSLSNGVAGAVVKANAYGLGIKEVGISLAKAGARDFFVAVAEEGAALRRAIGPGPKIYIFSGHMVGDTTLLRDFHLIPLINSAKQLLFHLENSSNQLIGIQLDTGMNRLGMEATEFQELNETISKLKPELIISHLACADDQTHPMNENQLVNFNAMTKDINCKKSLAATGGILLGKQYHFDITRPGIGLYGGNPYSSAKRVIGLKLPVIQIRTVLPGETVGYSNTWTAKKITKVATVSSGYADGIFRSMSNKATLYYNEIPNRVIGRISMDLIGVDVSNCKEDPDYLWLLNGTQSIDDLADEANSIGYEILTALGQRYNRIYI